MKVHIFSLIFILISSSVYGNENIINYKNIPRNYLKRAKKIISSPSITFKAKNKIKTKKFIYEYLLDRLHFTSKMIRKLKIGKYFIRKQKDGYWNIDDRNGAKAKVILIYRGSSKRIYYTRGKFSFPFLPSIRGIGLLIITYKKVKKNLLECKAYFYFRFSSFLLHEISKQVFYLIKKILDKKVQIVVLSAQKISERIFKDPQKLYLIIKASKDISKKRKREFRILFIKQGKENGNS